MDDAQLLVPVCPGSGVCSVGRGRSGLPSTVGTPVASGCSSTTLGIGCGRVELVLAVAELGLAWLVSVFMLVLALVGVYGVYLEGGA